VATVLAVGLGWFVRLAARPRTTRAALGAGAVTALVGALVAFSVIAPTIGVMAYKIQGFKLHPVRDPQFMEDGVVHVIQAGQQLDPVRVQPDLQEKGHARSELTPDERDYLAQFPAVEVSPGFVLSPEDMRKRATATNRIYTAIIYSWTALFILLVFYLGLTLESTWAADCVRRSGRGLVAQVVCYLELYPPAAALTIWCVGVLGTGLDKSTSPQSMGFPTWLQLLTPLGLGALWVGLAHAGVIRRWHPFVRITGYLVLVLIAWALLRH